ncbi:ABC transporter permease [Williamsia soli]|uniref:ABC transporter permease n=1 Tax=Williamsia soli TaxID=364929 RepID=UPI001A9FA17D|nr:ABC transporter permease [Williamsia soli]
MSLAAQIDRAPASNAAVRTSVRFGPALQVLSARSIGSAWRDGDLISGALTPVIFFVCFYVPLHGQFERSGIDYAQYLTPVILLQTGLFTAIMAAQNAGIDAAAGVRDRLTSLPISRSAPILARMSVVIVMSLVSTSGGLIIGSVFGFRFDTTAVGIAVFVLLVVVFALALSLLTDALGSVITNAESVGQALMIPQLILVMLSTGIVPAAAFPEWVQPVVRNSPVSQFADALRALSTGSEFDATAPTIWAVGLLVAGGVAAGVVGRRAASR